MRKFDTINVIPFIDIMLVLLAIVLTTATFITNGNLDIALPVAATDSAGDTREQTEIAIDSQQVIYLDGVQMSLEALGAQLESHPSDAPILLRIDETVPFSEFVSVVDLLKARDLENVSILTQKVGASTGASSTGTSAGN